MTAGPIERRAARLARLVALVATVLLASYLALRLRTVSPAWLDRSRLICGISILVWYWLTYRIVKRIAVEWLE